MNARGTHKKMLRIMATKTNSKSGTARSTATRPTTKSTSHYSSQRKTESAISPALDVDRRCGRFPGRRGHARLCQRHPGFFLCSLTPPVSMLRSVGRSLSTCLHNDSDILAPASDQKSLAEAIDKFSGLVLHLRTYPRNPGPFCSSSVQ